MSDQCEHEWHFFEESKDGCFCVKGDHSRLSREQAETMLNEHAALKRENEGFAKVIDRLADWIKKTNDSPLEAITEGYPDPNKMVAYLRQRAWEKVNLLALLADTQESAR